MARSESIYDALYIGKKLTETIGDFSEGEIQLFAYLSCLLALFDGKNVSSWGYMFIKNEHGSPFSNEISSAVSNLSRLECFVGSDKDYYFNITPTGEFFLEQIKNHYSNQLREKYLKIAVLMIDFFPYGILTNAINNEPLLLSSRQINVRRNLLDEDGSGHAMLYEQFELLKRVIEKENNELHKPAFLWINSLAFYKPNEEILR